MAAPDPHAPPPLTLGGALVALGGALLGRGRSAPDASGSTSPAPPATPVAERTDWPRDARPKLGRARVRTAPAPSDAPVETRYWPPPVPEPIEPPDDAHAPGSADRDRLAVDRRSETLGFEVKDATVARVAAIMALGVAVIALSVSGLFVLIGQTHRAGRATAPLTAQQRAVIVPPGPRLQDHPLHDIAVERRRETDLLRYYAWTDPSHRAGRIPIERALALVIGRPLDPPTAPAPPPAASAP